MLSFIRDNVQSVLIRFIVGIVALVMLSFGVSSFQDQGINVIATVDGHDIKLENYRYAFEQEQRRYRERYQDQADEAMKAANVSAQVVQRLINSSLVIQSAKDNGFTVTDAELANEIYANQAFQTDNRFDAEKYSTLLKSNRMDKISYELDLRNSLLSSKYQTFLEAGATISQSWLKKEFDKYQTEMDIRLIEIRPEMFAKDISLTDTQIEEYYGANPNQFKQKEQYRIQYFLLSREDVQGQVKVRDREIEKYYAKNKKKEFTTKEAFKSRHILITTPRDKNAEAMQEAKQMAQAAYEQIKANSSLFAALAKSISNDPGSAVQGGELGWAEKGTFVPEYENAVRGMEKGEIAPPFLSTFGYHIVQLQDTRQAQEQPMESVRSEIIKGITAKKAERRLKNKVNKLLKALETQSLEATAQGVDKEVITTKAFDDGTQLESLGYSYQLYTEMKGKKENDKGNFVVNGDKGTLVYQVSEVIPAKTKAFETIKDEAKAFAEREAMAQKADEKLSEYQAQASSKEAFEQLATTLKITPQDLTFKLTDPQVGSVRDVKRFQTSIYKMKKGETQSFAASGQRFLVYLSKKQISSTKKDEEELQKLKQQLREQKAQVLLNALVQERLKQAEVEYNSSMIQALNINI
ncbi:MAG: hypothetical protein COB67_03565 [SAR324 cluster bacterium]|uniref:Periplasmic chaperone PpiD n=1 Tax=SAR324 cluster bacterium TaxID=2024889 RepID=A0A2A4T991_9DELT|nr:MAG: hypothetical protein COB67_03565 [SAR324 cluster bacterium]